MISETLQKARAFEAQYGPHIPDSERPAFHATPTIGWMNDPNGFSFYKGECHLFYQYYPYSNEWGPMHWGHLKTRDFLRWERLPAALAPDQEYDSSGCFSGGAVELPDGRQLLMYTGVQRSHNADGFLQDVQTQCVAVGDGVNYEKWGGNPVLDGKDLPEGGSTTDFRDPKVWRDKDGDFYAVIGNRTADGSGAILLYRGIEDFKGEFVRTLDQCHNQYGKMWECPDFFPLDGKQMLITSPQDMKPVGLEFHAGNGTLCLIGEYDPEKGFFRQSAQAIDYGLDFYAPQTLEAPDGRRIMIAWMQNWDTLSIASLKAPWFGQMTVPRELSIKNGRLYQWPVRELDGLRSGHVSYQNVDFQGELTLEGIKGRKVDITITLRPGDEAHIYKKFSVWFGQDNTYHTAISFRPYESILKIDRKFSGSRRAIIHQRRCKVPQTGGAITFRMILDRFSVEIFVNHGEQTLSATMYTDQSADGFRFFADGKVDMDIEKYDLDGE